MGISGDPVGALKWNDQSLKIMKDCTEDRENFKEYLVRMTVLRDRAKLLIQANRPEEARKVISRISETSDAGFAKVCSYDLKAIREDVKTIRDSFEG